jgi:zinc transporter
MLEEGARIGSAVELLEMVVSHVADTMEQLSVKLGADLDDIEEKVLSEGTDDRRGDLGRVRRTCVRLHRHLSSLRLVFHRLDQNRFEKAADAIVLDVSRLARRLDELDHDIMAMRERSRVLQEELHLKIEEQSNKSLHLLSVLTSLMLPPTLITGIFGMNTKGLPLTDTDSGFLWAMVLLIGSSLTAFYIMKRLHIMR